MSRYNDRWAYGKLAATAKDYRPGCRDYLRIENPYVDETIPWYAPRVQHGHYTGDLLVGVATMHKSNSIPVTKGSEMAEATAKMRRG